ncbi:hypothetical protein PR202_ga28057 [Eleusine coracana subsp. coracana]|uniref:AAA+ ATPase domain-containing protein n=1 Tax=Eleusine coracana subsp. coracana TaxID=191504 RepID=A0AAV5DGS5_ELECO|nr:hypothetical protein QOZ80_7AG0559320 [Eleusine coracana subsp. coracana]GJN09999.1 hypothetical protein PR202_ga28057 [Eleusine coracana subsp. coracana]
MDSWWFANFTTAWFILAPLIAAYVPRRLLKSYFNHHVCRHAKSLVALVDPYVTVDIFKRFVDDDSISSSDAYAEVRAYLSAACSREARALRAESAMEGKGFALSLQLGQEVADEFRGAVLWWSSAESRDEAHQWQITRRCYRLTFHQRHRRLVVDEYLPHVRNKGKEALDRDRRRRIYTNNIITDYTYQDDRVWNHIDFKHPTTFDTLAMDAAKKQEIIDDLDAFRNNKEFYARTGWPWKRGYLLYGPPGTGKSTMIAAMANHLGYDVYDIELTVVRHIHDLRKLLVETTDKSIIVIEDIDCSLDLTGERRKKKTSSLSSPPFVNYDPDDDGRKRSKVTLSGVLNFIDGLWSACGGERIVVFTTNHVDKLDQALVRRGRMDFHIEMSYCRFDGFRTLAKNYLGIDDHPLFESIGEMLAEVDVAPVDVAECIMTSTRAGRGVDSSLQFLIEEVKKIKAKADAEAKAKAEEDESEEEEEDEEEEGEKDLQLQ